MDPPTLDGLAVMAWEIVAVLALVAMALFLLPRFLRCGVTTVPEYLAKRFDHQTQSVCTLIFLSAYALILLPIILYTGPRADRHTGYPGDAWYRIESSDDVGCGLVGRADWYFLRPIWGLKERRSLGHPQQYRTLSGGLMVSWFDCQCWARAAFRLD